jgi:hypothetical protein
MRIANGAGTSRPYIHWASGPIGATPPRGSKRFQVQGDGLWHIYTINLGRDSRWTSGPVSWLWLRFDSLRSGYRVEIDWVRLTPRQSRQVQWQGDSLSGSARVYLGLDSAHPGRYGDLLIYEGGETPLYISASAGLLYVPASLPPGEYHARVEAGGTGANSSASWRFLPLPIAEITAPSYTSGEDWATAVLGNPWDMDGLGDVSVDATKMDAIKSMSVSDGALRVVSKDDGAADCGEPWPHRPLGLNLGGQLIDHTKYRYFSYRYKVEDAPNQGAGGVSRVRWQARHLRYWPTGRTDDISFYDNSWHTYSLDLATVQQEGEMGEWEHIPADVVQIMLHESHREWTSHLDWVKLTAQNVATSEYAAKWNLVNASLPVTTTLYWSRQVGSGYELVAGTAHVIPASRPNNGPPSGGNVAFLPIVMSAYGSEGTAQFQHAMSMAGLQTGREYYLAVRLEDGHNVSWWYSELPVKKL